MESNILSIIKKKQKMLTDEEVLTCERIIDYLKGKAARVHQHFRIPESSLTLQYNPESDITAYTDNANYTINTGCSLVEGTRQEKLDIICGLLLHEIGHRLFTSSMTMAMYKNSIMSGTLLFKPVHLTPLQQNSLDELESYLSDDNHKFMFIQISQFLWNVLEDARIEYLLLSHCEDFLVLHNGLCVMREKVFDQLPSYLKMRESFAEDENKLSTLFQALLSYALYGEIKELDYKEFRYDELIIQLEPALQYADNCIETLSDTIFFYNLNYVILELWAFIKSELDKVEEDEKNQDPNGCPDKDKVAESLSEMLESITGLLKEDFETSLTSSQQNGILQSLSQSGDSDENENGSAAPGLPMQDENENKDGIPLKPPFTRNTNIKGTGGTGRIKTSTEYTKSVLRSTEKEIVQEQITAEREEEILEIIKESKGKINFGEIHRYVDCNIIKQPVDANDKKIYDIISPPLVNIAKKLAKKTDFFSEDENPVTFRNRYYGTRFHAETIARKDLRNFSQKVNLEEAPSLAVGILIDESGSMSGKKCEISRKMAIMLYEYCQIMNVSVSIYGHSTCGSDVALYPYTDFEGNFPNDKYRLSKISARSGNRDGYALRFMYHRLMEQPEDYKLLIIVSDGAPFADNYYGSGAFEDLNDIAKMCEKNDVIFLAAAIDEDKHEIMAAYGKQHFLDITDLEKLPVKMTGIIRSMLK